MSTRPDAGPNAMDATTQIPSDRRRGEPPFFRPYRIFFSASHFAEHAKCRNGHLIAPTCRVLEIGVHECSELHGRHKVGDRWIGPYPCKQLSMVWRMRGGGALVVHLRHEEAEWLQREGPSLDPTRALEYLRIGEEAERLDCWLRGL